MKDPFFVFEAVNCLGNENNIFDCELSPWGVEGCDDEDILAVACTNENMEDNFRLSALRDESHKITNALSNLLGLPSRKKAVHMIPILSFYNHKYGFCLSKNFGNLEATHLCQSQGYECGIPNFDNFVTTQSLEKQSKLHLFHFYCQIVLQLFSAFAYLRCPGGLYSNCHYEFNSSCQHQAHITCYSKCPVGFHLKQSASNTMPYKWDVKFKESSDTCRKIYVQDVKEQNLVNMGNSVLVSSTITTDQDYLEDHMYANEIPPDRSKCISKLILEICQCLPWQYNSQVERLTCNDLETLNCSVSVRNLWKSVGGNCETAVKVTKQMFRISLDADDICSRCDNTGSSVDIMYHVSSVGNSQCQEDNTISITMDHDRTVTYVRARPYSWISIVAGMGGIWSFVTGLSLISVVELIYWICNTLYNHQEVVTDEKDGSNKSLDYSVEEEDVKRPISAWKENVDIEQHQHQGCQHKVSNGEGNQTLRPKTARRGANGRKPKERTESSESDLEEQDL